jgi:hypothetical protein
MGRRDMKNESYRKELKSIGEKIIKESNQKFPDAVLLKSLIDNLHLVIEMIRRETLVQSKVDGS